MKKILISLLAATLMFTACSGGDAAAEDFSAATVAATKAETAPETTAETTAKTTRQRTTEAEVTAQPTEATAAPVRDPRELPLPDLSSMYTTWNLDNKPGGGTITFYEDGTFERHNPDGEDDSGTFRLNPMGIADEDNNLTLSTVEIDLDTDYLYVADEFYFFPDYNIIYGNQISFNILSVYALPGTDSETFGYYSKLAELITGKFENNDFEVSFSRSGRLTVDSFKIEGNTMMWETYATGTYEVNDDFTSVHITLKDGSFEGDCPLDIDGRTINIEPFGELEKE
jgi:hypothetical protein